MRRFAALSAILLLTLHGFAADTAFFESIRIVAGSGADAVEQRYADLLESRLKEVTRAAVQRGSREADAALTIHLGTADSYPALTETADAFGIPMPSEYDPGPEGFVLASKQRDGKQVVLAIGSDRRGVLYAVGEILRQAEGREEAIAFPTDLHLRRAPRWPVRGLLVFQGHTMRELTGAREWTLAEWQRAHLDYALAGANTFELDSSSHWKPIYDFLRDYGLRTHTVISGNAGSGPPEWQAKESIGRTG